MGFLRTSVMGAVLGFIGAAGGGIAGGGITTSSVEEKTHYCRSYILYLCIYLQLT